MNSPAALADTKLTKLMKLSDVPGFLASVVCTFYSYNMIKKHYMWCNNF